MHQGKPYSQRFSDAPDTAPSRKPIITSSSVAYTSMHYYPLTNETATSEGSEPASTTTPPHVSPIPPTAFSLSKYITRSLTHPPAPHLPSYGASIPAGSIPSRKYHLQPANGHLSPTPRLKFLDLSTCLVPESSLPHIIHHYPSLTHNSWIAAIFNAITTLQSEITFENGATFLLGDTPSGGGSSSSKTDTSTPERVRILPPLPTLRHVTTTLYVPASIIPHDADMPPPDILQPLLMNVQREWERGWAEGLVQLLKVRERLHTSWRNKLLRVVRFASPEEFDSNKLDTPAKSSTSAGYSLPFPPSTTVERCFQSELSSDGESEDPFQD
ncbi:hypothetical protein FB446DRAFT_801887 [Lentinula raphanica]|nr:hypothetical protein FB446DRAFT_801887 [Lentinula raphanica]